jgi:hypothetical protein
MPAPLGIPPPALRGRCALGQTRSGLGVWVARPRGSGASKAAGVLPFRRRSGGGWGRGKAMRRLTDFDPPGSTLLGKSRSPRELPLAAPPRRRRQLLPHTHPIYGRRSPSGKEAIGCTTAHDFYKNKQTVSSASCNAQRPRVLWDTEATGSICISGAGSPLCLRKNHALRRLSSGRKKVSVKGLK